MPGVLAESLETDLRCPPGEAETLASLARECVPRIAGGPEDTDEDLVVRLRDPRVFGEFAVSLLEDSRLSDPVRTALAERAFDLLPLPRGEGEVIVVESRAPSRLLDAAAFLARGDRLSVLHVLHLLYALFLNRALVTRVDRGVRSFVLARVLANPEVSGSLRAFYAAMHLAAVPEPEAHAEFRRAMKDPSIDASLKSSLAALAEDPDRGRRLLLAIAQEEGLVASGPDGSEEPQAIATIPRLPERLRPIARRWRDRNVQRDPVRIR